MTTSSATSGSEDAIDGAARTRQSGGAAGSGDTDSTGADGDCLTGQGLGLDYVLSPDDTQGVSNGLFLVAPFTTSKQASYVSPVNGPVGDVRLHEQEHEQRRSAAAGHDTG
jgi:hypothetical protein